jgi:hypothetical protein
MTDLEIRASTESQHQFPEEVVPVAIPVGPDQVVMVRDIRVVISVSCIN